MAKRKRMSGTKDGLASAFTEAIARCEARSPGDPHCQTGVSVTYTIASQEGNNLTDDGYKMAYRECYNRYKRNAEHWTSCLYGLMYFDQEIGKLPAELARAARKTT